MGLLIQWSFTQGFILGQLLTISVIYVFLRFFLFCNPPPQDLAKEEEKIEAIKSQQSKSSPSSPPSVANATDSARHYFQDTHSTLDSEFLDALYNVNEHEPESLDWFNVLIAQALTQFRHDASSNNVALRKLEAVLNKGTQDRTMVDHIYVKNLSLGRGFPVFSHCRVLRREQGSSQLRAEMLVSLNDNLTCTVETKLLLNFPKPSFATLPLSITISMRRFVGKMMIHFSPSNGADQPAYFNFSFDPDFVISLEVNSLIGARSKLQDIPKITQLIDSRVRQWFIARCVSPQFQQIAIPNFWPTSAKEGHARSQTTSADMHGNM
ncbi:ERMES complex subunit, membrane tether and lipid transfer protein Mmm1 [Schizosaccharomyces osmophilus]|uniref:Maintenance of mitochondrial morphology protein 1 n=1 Tax=Schizosaccharomyces osmophilus TaxID=2545709 RepID=A0AAE9W825_9SCHI|nr:ERMES complex subunit, membrane tether and lipid transfer protein Mmm1 [Schizosaccharomyces osmophilus]WBW70587.1 ERMES complex subunit, membrane tether and lipid transfer protein Mmm1 [Schizosaccharomyces osmophilus]